MMLDKKSVIVTGADSGIGLETAKILARAGGRVLTTGRSEETASKVAKDICDEGGSAVGMVVDVAQEADDLPLVKQRRRGYG